MVDCTGEEMEPCLQGIFFSRYFSWHIGTGTRWLLFILPEITGLYCVLPCAWGPSVEVIIIADISPECPEYREWSDESSHLGVSWLQAARSQHTLIPG